MVMPFEIIKLSSNLGSSVKSNQRALALGMFDGLHLGHRFLINKILSQSKKKNLIPCAMTFREFPQKWTSPNSSVQSISSLKERLLLFKALGLQEIIVFDFPALNQMEAESYLKNILLTKLNCVYLACGANHTFGKDKKGNTNLLQKWSAELENQFEFEICEPVYADNNSKEIVSSSLIRQYLQEGNIPRANQLLGHNFFVYDSLKAGKQLGRELGFPTFNLTYNSEKVEIPRGVYAGYTQIDNLNYLSAVNIGFAPTINKNNTLLNLESHLLELPAHLDLKIGENLKVELIKFMRAEKKFDSIEELKKQIELDCQNILKLK